MSGRGASASVITEWGKSQNQPVHLIEAYFDAADGGTSFVTDAYKPLTFGGNVYGAAGDLLGFTGLTESMQLRVANVQVQLSGVGQTYVAVFQQRQFMNRRLVIRQAFLDGSSGDAIISSPVIVHDGLMDTWSLVEDPGAKKSMLTVTSRDSFADFERMSGRHTNSNDQNLWFPTDRSFDKLAQINAQSFTWGRFKEAPATGLFAGLTRLVHSHSVSNLFKF